MENHLRRIASEYRSYRAWRNQELRRRLRGDLRKEEEERVEAGKSAGERKKEIQGEEKVIWFWHAVGDRRIHSFGVSACVLSVAGSSNGLGRRSRLTPQP